MDGYATAYVAHNLPLLVVSGLGADPSSTNARLKEGGVIITSDIAPLESEDAQCILKCFKENDAEKLPWNGYEHGEKKKFKVKVVGRVVKDGPPFLESNTEGFIGLSITKSQGSTSNECIILSRCRKSSSEF